MAVSAVAVIMAAVAVALVTNSATLFLFKTKASGKIISPEALFLIITAHLRGTNDQGKWAICVIAHMRGMLYLTCGTTALLVAASASKSGD